MITRDEALKIVRELIKNENLIRHHLAVEVTMRALAKYLKQDEEKWGLVGLLHDSDYELTKDPLKHTLVLEEELKKRGITPEPDVLNAIRFHNKENVPAQESLMGWAIYTCDELTGLTVACALIHPDKKLDAIDTDFVLRRFNEPNFAKGADRKRILPSEEKLGIPLREFVTICLTAMQSIHEEIGL